MVEAFRAVAGLTQTSSSLRDVPRRTNPLSLKRSPNGSSSAPEARPPRLPQGGLFRGLAPDGGLYMPRSPSPVPGPPGRFPRRAGPKSRRWSPAPSLRGRGARTPGSLAAEAFDFPPPPDPTCARTYLCWSFSEDLRWPFKDVGARFMARLLAHYRQDTDPPLTVLTATSGDTGGAVAHAFLGTSRYSGGGSLPRRESHPPAGAAVLHTR